MLKITDPICIITDLDGSLLDHFNYQWQPAQNWIDLLKNHQIPIIFCTSKTAIEAKNLQNRLGIQSPFICENGAIIYLNADKKHIIGQKTYSSILECIKNIKQAYHFKFQGFSDVAVQTIMKWTGLSEIEAIKAQQREASEPIVWQDSSQNLKLFESILKRQHLKLIQGGRFWHIMHEESGKENALAWLMLHYSKNTKTIGLGDSKNDLAFLEKTDFSVVIKNYTGQTIKLSKQDPSEVYYTKHYGPEGWSEGLNYFIK